MPVKRGGGTSESWIEKNMTFEEQRQKLKKEMHEALDKAFDDPKTPVFLDGKYTFVVKDGYLLIVSVLPNEYAAFKRKTQEKR